MSADSLSMTGLFESEEETLSAIQEIRERGWQVEEVFSPIPSSKISKALNRKKSIVGWFTLTGGITGFISGFSLAILTATRWSLIVSGKPIASWIPFFIIAFEFTILFAVLGNIVGLITQLNLPAKIDENYNPVCSGSFYGVQAQTTSKEFEKLKSYFQEKSAVH
jgi:molybdopterin-containing oxidoreductase family membrane subunit